jgi:hypothetical protein
MTRDCPSPDVMCLAVAPEHIGPRRLGLRAVAVGTAVARRPPHRSGRAVLPHPAPTLGDDAKPVKRIRVTDVNRWNPAREVASHARPGEAAVTPATQCLPPEATHRPRERGHWPIVQRHRVVLHVPLNHGAHIRPEFRDGSVHALPEDRFNGLQLRLHPASASSAEAP